MSQVIMLILMYILQYNNQMSLKSQQLKKQMNEARNLAYLCKYKQSQAMYKKIIENVEQQILLNNIPKHTLPHWKIFQDKVTKEKNIVDTLANQLLGFNSQVLSPIQIDRYNFDQQQPIIRQPNNNFRTTNRNYSLIKPTNSRNNHQEQPQPLRNIRREVSIKKQIKSIPNKSNQNIGTKPKVIQRNGSQNQQKNQVNAKKGFLLDRYPNGSGPDTNLIEMLEREVLDKSPNVTFDDIAELDTAKGLLQQAVLLPLKMPQFFTGIRRAWRGVLMFGPPGTGKTLLAKAVASNGGTTFFNVSASSLASKWKGQSQKLVRILFEMAKYYAPSVIFFDEIDALGGKRKDGQDESNRKVKTQLLVQMDGATSSDNEQNKFVIVLAATNRPWDLDEALRRRLEKRIYIPLPSEKGRKQLVKINMKNIKLNQGIDFDFIVKNTEGFSGADITNVCREAAYQPMRRILKAQGGFKNIQDLKKFQEEVNVPIGRQDFLEALKSVNKSVGKQDLKKYQQWMKQFGSV